MGEEQNPLEVLSLEQLRQRRSAKWRAFGDDVLPLWVAEMDVPLAPPVSDALHRMVELGDTGYPMPAAYAESLQRFAAQQWGWEPDITQIRTVPDVMRGVVEALKIVTQLADTVIVNSPVYPPFFNYPVNSGLRVVEAPLGEDGRLDFEMLEESFNLRTLGGTAVYLLCNPHNPTGVVHTREELQKVAALAEDYGVRVVADEIHAPIVYGEAEFVPYVTVDPKGFSLVSASKAFNLAGLKAGLLVSGTESAAELSELPKESAHGASHAGVLAQTAALNEGSAWLHALTQGLEANRRLLGDLLAEHAPEVTWRQPEATYLAWLDFSAYGFDDDEPTPGAESPVHGPAKFLLKEAKVALTAGHPFGTGGERHARLNFATSPEILTQAVERIGQALARR
ncbi:MalY/PatB family protein [Nesterenkonia alba]|uniref:MalY/PatB family protein n=1 Tax=Nesterenkonia alba TaxID=515814 RepID=UPI0003B57558|nr:MalY/PatB family protein [Nesterenkonia alba]